MARKIKMDTITMTERREASVSFVCNPKEGLEDIDPQPPSVPEDNAVAIETG